MAFSAILFDLDGTLLPMDQDIFIKAYFKYLTQKLAPEGLAPQQVIDGIQAGTAAMVRNDGSRRNEEVFWAEFAVQLQDEGVRRYEPLLYRFYCNEFQQVQQSCGYTPEAKILISRLQQEGRRLILATNPIFPAIATESRIRWAGLQPSDFELYTTYENSRFCKPNPEYYRDILQQQGLRPEECLMIGNDAIEDVAAQQLGIPVFLLTDCLINRRNSDISAFPHGTFADLHAFLDTHK